MAGLLTPAVGVQLYVVALLLVLALIDAPGQILVSLRDVMVKLLVSPIVTGCTVTHPVSSVMVAW